MSVEDLENLSATFTVLNLFIGIIVSTMQELAMAPEESAAPPGAEELIRRMEADLKALRSQVGGS